MNKKSILNKIELASSFLKKNNSNFGKIFLPNDEFYGAWNDSDDTLRLMAAKIINWLNFKVKLFIGFYNKMEPPGLYIHEKGKEGILINSQYKSDPYKCAAILSHELMHYYLMKKHNTILDDTLDNELLTDIATIYSGLGILVTNSFYYESNWHETVIAALFGSIRINQEQLSFGYFKPKEYVSQFVQFVKKFNINLSDVYIHILPSARAFLPLVFHKSKLNKPEYILINEKISSKVNIKRTVAVILFIPLAVLFWYWKSGGFNDTKSVNDLSTQQQVELSELKGSIDQLKIKYDNCTGELSVKQNSLNTIENQMNTYKYSNPNQYNGLVPQQNQLVNEYNLKLTECQNIEKDYDTKIDQHNQLINK